MADPTSTPPPASTSAASSVGDAAIAGLIAKGGGDLAKTLGTLPGIAGTQWGQFFTQVGKSADVAGDSILKFNGIAPQLVDNVKEVLGAINPASFGDSLANLSGKLFQQIDNYQKINQEFIKLGRGADSKQYIESIRQQSFETMKLGISSTKLIEINKELINSYTGATLILDRQTEEFKKNQKQITELIGFNDKFGVSQGETTKILNLFNTTMEGGSKGAQKLSDNLLIFAQRTGQGAGKVFQEFNANIDRFATMSSERAVASFQKLELAAARTGGSVSNIVSAVEKFDDIESGFSAGGQLNRVLSFMGGSFDTFKAMQASDEDRAQMLYQAIAQTGDRFQQLQSEGAKRQMAKQIAESSGLDIKTVVGLLNKSTNLASDMKELSMRPPVTEEFTAQGREQAAMAATTTQELHEIQKGLFDLNPIVQKLSDNMQIQTEKATKFFAVGMQGLDKSLVTATKNAENAEGFLKVAESYLLEIKNVPGAFEKAAAEFTKKTREPMEGVLSRNTTIHEELHKGVKTFNENAAKGVKLSVEYVGKAGEQVKIKQKPLTAGDAISSVPPPTQTLVEG